ncbi:MAG: GTP-binding protein, partial [Deltaproteobacteria bacterium]|nr:GTP-binding protein [Deltaproteobacteria bacterium]
MKPYPPERIRNIVLVGNKGVGKTSLGDALCFVAGLNNRRGRVEDGTSLLDADPQELRRKQTILAKVVPIEWRDHKINLIDTPGFADFWGETVGAMWIADVVVIVVDASVGVPVATKRLYKMAREFGKPVAFFVTRLDQPDADSDVVAAAIREQLGARAAILAMPLGSGPEFRGVVDLLECKTFVTAQEKTTVGDVDEGLRAKVEAARTEIMDDVAETEPELMEKYLGGTVLSHEELHHGLAKGIEEGTIAPICCGSALTLGGVEAFAQMVVDWFPAPTEAPAVEISLEQGEKETRRPDLAAPFTAQVFKSTSDPGIGDIAFFRVFAGQVSHGEDVYNASRRTAERMGHIFVMRGRERMEVEKVCSGDIAAVAKLKGTGIGDTLCAKARAGTCAAIPFPQPMISLAVKPKTKADQDKLGVGLQKLMAIDPTFRMHIDAEFNETVVEGLGEIHLETTLERLRERFGIDIEIGKPRVAYRERLLRSVKVQGKYKKQSGGRGQYGDCWIEVQPL